MVASVDINFEIQKNQLQNQENHAWSRDRSKLPVHSIVADPRSNRHTAFLLASGGYTTLSTCCAGLLTEKERPVVLLFFFSRSLVDITVFDRTGIVDMEKLEITHIHMPPGVSSSGCAADPEFQESFLGKKRLAWSSIDNALVSPSPTQVSIYLLTYATIFAAYPVKP